MARAGVGFAISAAAGRTHGGRKTRAAGGSRDRFALLLLLLFFAATAAGGEVELPGSSRNGTRVVSMYGLAVSDVGI